MFGSMYSVEVIIEKESENQKTSNLQSASKSKLKLFTTKREYVIAQIQLWQPVNIFSYGRVF